MSHPAEQGTDHGDLVRAIERARERVAPRLPDIDPGDLLMILERLLQPPGSGKRMFIRQLRPGIYVP